jgi:UDP-GlcNAc3NAcA epimerase
MKVMTILGARPQFIKAATVGRVIQNSNGIQEIIVHTGQHFDANMSDIFFEQLDIPKPDYNLGVAGLTHGAMTGRMLEGIERLILKEQPDWVLVYGDTNSTLAGALAASKLHVPIAHVEAGLRSNNPNMPEEINRVLTDRVSNLLLCPTSNAVKNLHHEGFPFIASEGKTRAQIQNIENVGDVMYDAVRYYRDQAKKHFSLDRFSLQHKGYAVCTLHRQENTDNAEHLANILSSLHEISLELPIVLPLHPRTRIKLDELKNNLLDLSALRILEPLSYLEMQRLLMSANVILTDSGGVQKEAYFHQVPCITLRDETEWIETVDAGWNQLVGADKEKILSAFRKEKISVCKQDELYGDGSAAEKILDSLMSAKKFS